MRTVATLLTLKRAVLHRKFFSTYARNLSNGTYTIATNSIRSLPVDKKLNDSPTREECLSYLLSKYGSPEVALVKLNHVALRSYIDIGLILPIYNKGSIFNGIDLDTEASTHSFFNTYLLFIDLYRKGLMQANDYPLQDLASLFIRSLEKDYIEYSLFRSLLHTLISHRRLLEEIIRLLIRSFSDSVVPSRSIILSLTYLVNNCTHTLSTMYYTVLFSEGNCKNVTAVSRIRYIVMYKIESDSDLLFSVKTELTELEEALFNYFLLLLRTRVNTKDIKFRGIEHYGS